MASDLFEYMYIKMTLVAMFNIRDSWYQAPYFFSEIVFENVTICKRSQ